MKKIGVTGGIGSGKSTVCRAFQALGFAVYFADDRAKALMNENPTLKTQISNLLGAEAYRPNGELDRAFVSKAVFNAPEKLTALNALVHPAVRDDFADWAKKQESETDKPFLLKEAAIIFETGSQNQTDGVILVVAPLETRINRVMERDGLSRAEIESRLGRQWTDEQKMPLADFIIHNDGLQPLELQIEAAIRRFSN